MANHFSLHATLLLLATSSALMVMVASDLCKEEIGDCSNDCNNKCASAHQGGQGKCGPGLGGQDHCWCYYDCPPLKTCDDYLLLQGGCKNDQQCDLACAVKFPGKGAQGKCQVFFRRENSFCQCTHFCFPPGAAKLLP